MKAVYGTVSSNPSNEASDRPDPYAIPWDTRNVGSILGAFQTAFAQDISTVADGSFDYLQVAGPDGEIYRSDLNSPQQPCGTIAAGTNQLTTRDGEVHSLPDEAGQISIDSLDTQIAQFHAARPYAVGPDRLPDSPGPYRSVTAQPGYRGSIGDWALPNVYVADPDDDQYVYLGYNPVKGNGGVDAGLQWSVKYSDWEPYMLVSGTAVSFAQNHGNPGVNKDPNGVPYIPAQPVTNYNTDGIHVPANGVPLCGFWAWVKTPYNNVLKISMFIANNYAVTGDGPLTGIGCAAPIPDINNPAQSIYIKRVNSIAQKSYGIKPTGSYQQAGEWFQGLIALPDSNDDQIAWQPPTVPTYKDGSYEGGQTQGGKPIVQNGTASVTAVETSKFVQEDNMQIFISH